MNFRSLFQAFQKESMHSAMLGQTGKSKPYRINAFQRNKRINSLRVCCPINTEITVIINIINTATDQRNIIKRRINISQTATLVISLNKFIIIRFFQSLQPCGYDIFNLLSLAQKYQHIAYIEKVIRIFRGPFFLFVFRKE